MGQYLTKGTTFADGGPCNAALLNAHVDDAIIKPTAISSQTLKSPSALSDELLINDGGALKKITLQQLHDLIIYPGAIVQTQYGEYTANTNLNPDIPADDTIPQITEGTEIIAVTITPRFSTSTILLTFEGQITCSGDAYMAVALFRNAIAGALASRFTWSAVGTDALMPVQLAYMDSPASTSAQTYRIRAGCDGAIVRFNGLSASRLGAGSSRATLIAQEIKV